MNFKSKQCNVSTYDSPFLHIQYTDFFTAEALLHLKEQLGRLPEAKFDLHPVGYKYTVFPSREFFQFIYSGEFTDELARQVDKKVLKSKKYPYPQVYLFPAKAGGITPHTDYGEERDLALIFYLGTGWAPSMGGELALYKGNDLKAWGPPVKLIEPHYNSAVLIHLGKNSWHSVMPAKQGFQRVTLIVDWDFE